jgi:hypothetical protein
MPLALPVRKMPSAAQLGEFLGDLLGKEITVTPRADELDGDDGTAVVCGVLRDEQGQVGGACIADLPAAAYVGAALAMIPKGAADEAVAGGELTETLRDNFGEVVNILTGVVNTPIHAHLRMVGVEAGVSDDVRALLIKAAGRSTFDVEVDDYGTGRIALFAR